MLGSLHRQSLAPLEIVVVDDSGGRLPILSSAIRVVSTPKPRSGPSVARNIGWRAASGKYVAFIDDDCQATPDWLAALVDTAGGRDNVIVQGRTLPVTGEELGPFSRSMWVESLGPWYQTCNVLYPRALLERVDGFDAAAFPFVGEDADLAWRSFSAGASALWAPDALVHHAVNDLGPVGALRVAWRWGDSVGLFARHRELRSEALTKGLFWKGSHYLLVRALLGLLLPRRLRPVAAWLWAPYVAHLLERGRVEGGGAVAVPWFLVHDVVETVGVVRGAVRERVPVV